MKPLSQRDPKWGSQKLGFGRTTIHNYGCTISSISMLFGTTPDIINNKLKSVNGYAGSNKNLVIWSKLSECLSGKFIWRGYSYDNDKVKEAIDKNGGCLVEVDGSRIGASRHWVLYIGNGQMNDPWFGTTKSTSYYRPVGYARIDVDKLSSTNESMPNKLLEHIGVKTEEEAIKVWDKEMSFLKSEREKASRYRAERDGARTRANELVQAHQAFLDKVAKKIDSLADESHILEKIEMDMSTEDQLRQQLKNTEKMASEEKRKLEAENAELKDDVRRLKAEVERLLGRVETVEKRLKEQEGKKEQLNLLETAIEWFNNIFKKG
jgi:FtsZ-binding cell division protein ZapB